MIFLSVIASPDFVNVNVTFSCIVSPDSADISALSGDTIQENVTFTLTKSGDAITDKKITISLPENTTYINGTLKLNGTSI